MKKISTLSAVFIVIILGVFPGSKTSAVQGKNFSRESFQFILPEGWSAPKDIQPKGRRKAREKIVLITKDGYLLDRVEFRKRLLTAEFSNTRKVITGDMMPQETADVILDDFELDETMKNFKLLENRPATVSGIQGFRLVFSYRINGTLQYQSVYYGFKRGEMLYSIWYSAPRRHYFETNLGIFEQIIKSFKVEDADDR